MIKALLLDMDGIVIAPREMYFSHKFAEEYDLPLKKEVLPFFTRYLKKCSKGEIDIKKVLPEYLKKWNWKGSINDFMTYWFESENEVVDRVINIVKDINKQEIICCLVSDNEKYRADYLMNELGLKNHFDEGFFSCYLGYTKSEPEFFEAIIEKLNLKSEEIIYFDDDQKNVDVAKKVGINARLYKSPSQLKRLLQ